MVAVFSQRPDRHRRDRPTPTGKVPKHNGQLSTPRHNSHRGTTERKCWCVDGAPARPLASPAGAPEGLSTPPSLQMGFSTANRQTTGGLGNQGTGGQMTATLLAANAVAWIALAIALVTLR
jgi:hypothetical protein